MALVEMNDVSRYFGARCIFSAVNLSLPKQVRVGIIGRNGEGKTTLLRVIAGELEHDSGEIHIASDIRLGYLSQGLPCYSSTVFDEAMSGKPEVLEAASKMRKLESKMASGYGDTQELLNQYAKAQSRFEGLYGYDLEHEVAEILAGLGFPKNIWSQKAEDLSGGQKVRLNLVKLLVSRPDVLLLDEPTNHMDISGVEWLEGYLNRYPGAVVVVSHDRRFLDVVVDRIWEIESGTVTSYRGNFSAYVHQKEEVLKAQRKKYEEQQRLIKRTMKFIRKWRANARRSGQARSREKMLDRLELIEKPGKQATLKLELTFENTTGKEVLALKNLSKQFDDVLFRDLNLLLLRGERLALIGPNGCGKSTLLKCIKGIESYSGIVRWGAGVKKAYYAQDFDFDFPEKTVLEHVKSFGVPHKEARDILGRFLFSGDDVKKRIKDLSGGESSRLALLQLVLSDANVLLLDEPTNHLDLPSRRALEEAVADFQGTVIFASHDRYFIDKVATKILYFRQGQIEIFQGNYTNFKHYIDSIENEEEKESGFQSKPKFCDFNEGACAEKKCSFRLDSVDLEIENLEYEITCLEERKQEIATILADPKTYSEPVKVSLKEWGLVCSQLEELYKKWEELVELRQNSLD